MLYDTAKKSELNKQDIDALQYRPYENKKILFMGDSITHLYLGDRGWPKYFNAIVNPVKTVCVAVSGARWHDTEDTVYDGNPQSTVESNNTIGNQVEKIIRGKDSTNANYAYVADYADFDIIIIACGTNDSHESLVAANVKSAMVNEQWGTTLPLENVDKTNMCGAMRYAYEKLHALYPNARIYYCSPVQTYPSKKVWGDTLSKGDIIKEMCRHIPVTFIDTEKCGIYGYQEQYNTEGIDLIDGLHPTASGAVKIGTYNAKAIIRDFIGES